MREVTDAADKISPVRDANANLGTSNHDVSPQRRHPQLRLQQHQTRDIPLASSHATRRTVSLQDISRSFHTAYAHRFPRVVDDYDLSTITID